MTQTKITFSLVLFITFYLKGWEIMLGIKTLLYKILQTQIFHTSSTHVFPGAVPLKLMSAL